MRTIYIVICLLLLGVAACRKTYEAPVPDATWPLFESSAAVRLTKATRTAMEGVYRVEEGSDNWGTQVALKWSYTISGGDTVHHLSVFSGKEFIYFLLQGKRLGDSILLSGYWRKMINTETGLARLVIPAGSGARELFGRTPVINTDSIIIRGTTGNGVEEPDEEVSFHFLRKLNPATGFEILAHRAGGRTSDLLPVAENSIGMIKMASRLGATGIEIDVRMTRDKVPVLYHDNTLNLRLIQKNGLMGPLENYSFDQLDTYVRLLDGQRIPGLREALNTVVHETELRYVWLDIKYEGSLDRVRQLQREFMQRAQAAGRQLTIVIGLPSDAALNEFQQLNNYQSVPSLCELTLSQVRDINAMVWAPRWTLGLQSAAVAEVQAEGRKAFVWTLDEPRYIDQFISQGSFDGILSNYPSLVAYYHYVKQ